MKDGDLAMDPHAGASSHGEAPVIEPDARPDALDDQSAAMAQIPPSSGPQTAPSRMNRERRARLEELMDEHGEAVFGFCVRMLHGHTTLAEDVRQQVFFEAYRDLDRFAAQSSIRSWLFGIARHRCIDAMRNQRRWKLAESDDAVLELEDPGAGLTERVDRARLVAMLEDCLRRLPADQRATVLMRFQTGATYEQLAEHLAASPEALQLRVTRALPKLRRCLESKGWTDE